MTTHLKDFKRIKIRRTKTMDETMVFLNLLAKNNKVPTVELVAKRFGIAISSAWERIQRAKILIKVCPFCNHKL